MKLVLIFVLFSTATAQDPCRGSYKSYSDTHGIRNPDNSSEGSLCDEHLPAGWYRWFIHGQDAIIPTSCTPANKCGTKSTMWIYLFGKRMPSVGRDVQGRVCASWKTNCCLYPTPATVRNCGSYYVYYLHPFSNCYYAYCLRRKL